MTFQPPSPRCPSPPRLCPRGGPQAPGLPWQLGLKEFWESRAVLRAGSLPGESFARTTAIPLTETHMTIMTSTSLSSGLYSVTTMRYFLHFLQLLSTCMAFFLVTRESTWSVDISNWSMFVWCFCFSVTLLTLIVELCRLQDKLHFSWNSFLITSACYCALFCLSASIIYPIIYLQIFPDGSPRHHVIAATAFSCIASVVYAIEVVWTCVRTGESSYSLLGLLKRLEIFVACVIFAFLSNTYPYEHQPALVWCVAVYCVCFILGVVAILWHRCDCDESLPYSCFGFGQSVLSVLLYTTALVLWPLYQFNEQFGGQPQRSNELSCIDKLTSYLCVWDQRLAVAILTAINLLIYVADLVILTVVLTPQHTALCAAVHTLGLWRSLVAKVCLSP
ncbi:myeloid-associated differentiation marker-like [Muntiacus reevesi]|uniref:myeloid-associated differentiation marker-like n=1 Tax=Muntiacus reevesi TaxID=9886 RepID=UPI003307202B